MEDAIHFQGESKQKYLISEDGESFLQGQLEPVAAGYAVPCPIVEVPAQSLTSTASVNCYCCLLSRHVQSFTVRMHACSQCNMHAHLTCIEQWPCQDGTENLEAQQIRAKGDLLVGDDALNS